MSVVHLVKQTFIRGYTKSGRIYLIRDDGVVEIAAPPSWSEPRPIPDPPTDFEPMEAS